MLGKSSGTQLLDTLERQRQRGSPGGSRRPLLALPLDFRLYRVQVASH